MQYLLLALADPYEQSQLHAVHGSFYLINNRFQLKDEPDFPTRLQQTLKQVGEDKLIAIMIELIQHSPSRIGAYAVLFLEAFSPYMTTENRENRVKPVLDHLTEEMQTTIQETLKRHFPS